MRPDSLGFFWEDLPPVRGKGNQRDQNRPIAPIPDSDWKPPTEFPNLSGAKVLGIDTETRDPELKSHGPGFARGEGEVVGISISTKDAKWYFPIAHTLQPEMNMNKEMVLAWLADVLGSDIPKVGANLYYDVGWLREEGVTVNGPLYDILIAEALLDERAVSYSLDSLGEKYLGGGKTTEQLYEWCADSYGGKPTGKQRENIWRAPVSLVGPYAEDDALLPLQILTLQWAILDRDGLLDLFLMECKLTRILLDMRFRGTPIDVEKAEQARSAMILEEETMQLELDTAAGFEFGLHTADHYVRLFENLGLTYPKTKKGNPSFTKSFMQQHNHPLVRKIVEVKALNKARTSFIENAILDKHTDGKIHTSFHPLRSDDGGTVSGRFSSSLPNLQQIPSRNKHLAGLIRGVFVPEAGYPLWLKADYSQIEYRCFAGISQDKSLIQSYRDNPNIDYHALVSTFLNDMLERPVIKNLNFASLYAAGVKKIIQMLQEYMSKEEAEEILLTAGISFTSSSLFSTLGNYVVNLYHAKFPAAKATLERIMASIQQTGEVRTVLNRRTQFNLYEPMQYGKHIALPYRQALVKWGSQIKIANTYKGLNYRLQGSAADLLKKGMVDAYEAGVFDRIGAPHLTVHDELDFSYHPDLAAGFLELKYYMENALDMGVPVILDIEAGPDWGHVKDYSLQNDLT